MLPLLGLGGGAAAGGAGAAALGGTALRVLGPVAGRAGMSAAGNVLGGILGGSGGNRGNVGEPRGENFQSGMEAPKDYMSSSWLNTPFG